MSSGSILLTPGVERRFATALLYCEFSIEHCVLGEFTGESPYQSEHGLSLANSFIPSRENRDLNFGSMFERFSLPQHSSGTELQVAQSRCGRFLRFFAVRVNNREFDGRSEPMLRSEGLLPGAVELVAIGAPSNSLCSYSKFTCDSM